VGPPTPKPRIARLFHARWKSRIASPIRSKVRVQSRSPVTLGARSTSSSIDRSGVSENAETGARIDAKMSQPAVAHRAGVSRSTVACIETLAKGDIGISVRVQLPEATGYVVKLANAGQ
tara:strand:- start:8558 stop:8914 length:357 start_codon:yes stop_codon:yes gene_type:complete